MKKLNYQLYIASAGKAHTKDNNNLYLDGEFEERKIKSITSIATENETLLEKPDVDEDLIEYLEGHKEIEFNNNESCLEETFVVDSASKWGRLDYIRTTSIGLECVGIGIIPVFKNAMYQILIFPEGSTGRIPDFDDNIYIITMKETVRVYKKLSADNTWADGIIVPSSKYEVVPAE